MFPKNTDIKTMENYLRQIFFDTNGIITTNYLLDQPIFDYIKKAQKDKIEYSGVLTSIEKFNSKNKITNLLMVFSGVKNDST